MILPLLCALLLAPPAAARSPEGPPPSLAAVWAARDPSALLDEAIARRSLGDLAGARERLSVLRDTDALPAATAYHLALTDELAEDYTRALAGYDTLLARFPAHELARDASFRRAIVLADLGEHAEAARSLRHLHRQLRGDPGTTEDDRLSLALVRGASELADGRERRGVRRVEQALARLQGTDRISWVRSRARLALVQALLSEAATLSLPPRKADKRLVERAGLMQAAEQQVIAIANLGEPEQSLAGLMALGDAYLALYDDLLAAPPPRKLDADQVETYRQAVQDKADVLVIKAWRYYDQGVALATRIRWQGGIVDDLRARRDALDVDAPARGPAAPGPSSAGQG